jgi:catechol 2,3-dioxygenase-like lactoylglutathione lyase family enzyme
MNLRIAHLALLVRDYDEAKHWFTSQLGFVVLEDTPLSAEKRWLRVAPPGGGAALLLARARGAVQEAAVGGQGGGRVWLFLETDDLDRDYRTWKTRGVRFMEEPRSEPYGRVVVFTDLYGNRWDLIEPAPLQRGEKPSPAM